MPTLAAQGCQRGHQDSPRRGRNTVRGQCPAGQQEGLTGKVWAHDPANGKRRDLSKEEEHAFWAFAVVEVLRATGIRIEELTELSHHGLVQYRLPGTGELVPLLQIAPSKTDAERLLLVSPELGEVLAAIICRVRASDRAIPLVAAYDDLHHRCRPERAAAAHRRTPGYKRHDGYKAVYPDEAIEAHRAFIARRRATRHSEECRTPTDSEWDAFLAHFEKRKVSVGTCARAFGSPCIHEHACVRCSLLRPDPAQRHRLEEIRANLLDRIAEAEREGWLAEVEGLQVSLAGADDKLTQITASLRRTADAVQLGMPAVADIAGRSSSDRPVVKDAP
jgi:hypothetical protein